MTSPVQGQQPPEQGQRPSASQWPAYDPSQNVLNLVTAAMQRQDDLITAAMQRQDDLRERDAAHAREMRETARMYESRLDASAQLLRVAEADRIDAIQTRSDLTVQRAAEVQAAQQQALATQVTATADTFRASIATELAPIKAALAEVQRAQYETQGQKQQVVESRDVRGEARLNQGQVIAYALLAIALIGLILAYVTKP